jgi:RNA polymerase-binding protein DksA
VRRKATTARSETTKRAAPVKKTTTQPKTDKRALKIPVSQPAKSNTKKKVTWLKQDDLATFRDLLLAKRQQLVGDVNHMRDDALKQSRKDAAGDLSSMPIHMADIGSDNYEQEFTLGLIEGEEGLLHEIDEALERVENGTYGICLATGKRIAKARLNMQPWAKYCIEYVRKTETNNHNGS